jgi:hypothetical protein
MIGHGCLVAVQPSLPKIPDTAGDFLSREHAKESAAGNNEAIDRGSLPTI